MPPKRPAIMYGRQGAPETSASSSNTDGNPSPSNSHRTGLHKVFTDAQYYDLIICCQERTWKVHRAIICAQSGYFDKFVKELSDGNFKEAHERITYLDDEVPDDVESLLLFLYTNVYPRSSYLIKHGLHTSTALLRDASLYTMAIKYDVPGLKAAAAKAFNAFVSKGHLAVGHMRYLYDVIVKVYKTTPSTDRTLRDPLSASIPVIQEIFGEEECTGTRVQERRLRG